MKTEMHDMAASAVEMAALLGVSTRSVRGYAERGIIERTEGGRYPLSGIKKYFDHLAGQVRQNAEPGELSRERAGLTRVRAQEVQLRLDATLAALVPYSDVVDGWNAIMRIVRAQVLSMPSKIGAKVPNLTEIDLSEITSLMHEMLENIDEEAVALGVIGGTKTNSTAVTRI